MKKNIKDIPLRVLQKDLEAIGEPSYRAEQIFAWLYRKGADSFLSMTDIPQELRQRLNMLYIINSMMLDTVYISKQGVEKFVYNLHDGKKIESVLIYSGKRVTLCISSQVGCKFRCVFCASGSRGFIRNLAPSEIVDQVLLTEKTSGKKITNFVFMGMGEPLDNLDNVATAIEIMKCKSGMCTGMRRITISTCGLVPAIEKMRKRLPSVKLSVSLHATDDKLRTAIMPVNKRYTLKKLMMACRKFLSAGGRKLTFEYILIKGLNDSRKDARQLSLTARRLNAKVNLIPFSPVDTIDFEVPSKSDINLFKHILEKKGVSVTVRDSKGTDINAACGQLAMLSHR